MGILNSPGVRVRDKNMTLRLGGESSGSLSVSMKFLRFGWEGQFRMKNVDCSTEAVHDRPESDRPTGSDPTCRRSLFGFRNARKCWRRACYGSFSGIKSLTKAASRVVFLWL